MISNSNLTIYHKSISVVDRLEQWTKYNYSNIWFYGRMGTSGTNKEYNDGADSVEIRIPLTESIDINNFSIGDIIVQGSLTTNIQTQQDLEGYKTYNITNINNNNFGNNPHIHITGK